MMKIRSFFVPALTLLALTSYAQAPQGEAVMPNLVTVSGTAESKAAPDLATIRIGVQTSAKTAKEAQTANNEKANKIIEAALKIVPDRKAFQTSDLSLYPQQAVSPINTGDGGGLGQPRVVGYMASNILTVRLEDVTKIGPLVDAVTTAGATNIDSIAFGLKDDKAARRQTLRDAVRDARDKAEALAEGLGLRLGDVYSIEEGGGVRVMPYRMESMAMAKMDTPVMPGQVSLSGNVTVRFRLVK
ncbi:DUF541 domain-containing protein [bacterium]|nr:MAG: DUF541 domain-containing protein [bacterium]